MTEAKRIVAEARTQARRQREESEAMLRRTELAHALRRQVHGRDTAGQLGADLVRSAGGETSERS